MNRLNLFTAGLVVILLALLSLSCAQQGAATSVLSFPVTPSNSGMTDPVTLHDFVPFGMCSDGENALFFHASVNIGGSHFRLMFNGQRFYRFLQGPSYYDEGGRYFPFPTVYSNPAAEPGEDELGLELVAKPLLGAVTASYAGARYAYIGTGGTFLVFDIRDIHQPVLIGQTWVPDIQSKLRVSGHFAYIADEFGGLRIIDVSDPADPREAGSFTAPSPRSWFRDLQVKGGYAYVADGGLCYLRIIEVSDPSMPVEVARVGNVCGAALDFSGDYAFVYDGSRSLRVFDISNPVAPREVGHAQIGGSDGGSVEAFGRYVIPASMGWSTGNAGIEIFDVSNPQHPNRVGYFRSKEAWDVVVEGSIAYVADGKAGLRILDLSDPSNPRELSAFREGIERAFGVFVRHPYAFVSDYAGPNWVIVDVSDPANPQKVYSWSSGGNAYQIETWRDYAFIAGGESGLWVYDVANPEAWREVAKLSLGQNVFAEFLDYPLLYLTTERRGRTPPRLLITDVQDPGSPRVIGELVLTPEAGSNVGLGLAVEAGYAYALTNSQRPPGGEATLHIINVRDPTQPVEVAKVEFEHGVSQVGVADGYTYVPVNHEGLYVFDVSDPTRPREVGFLPSPGEFFGLFVGDYVFLADRGPAGLHVIDVSEPSSPRQVVFHELDAPAFTVFIEGDLAYVGTGLSGASGLWVLDLSNIQEPRPLGFHPFGDRVLGVSPLGAHLLVATGWCGAQVVEVTWLGIPDEYLLWYKAWDRFLEEMAQPPAEFHPMKFGAHLITANPFVATFPEAYRRGTPEEPAFNELPANPFAFWDLETSLKLIDLFAELDVDYVKVMMRYPDDPVIRVNYDRIFQRIREHGLELLIRHDVMGPEYLYIAPKAPDAFEKEREKRRAFIYEVVAQYQPEYLELPPGPTGWRALLRMLPDIRRWLDEVSPGTKIIMQVGPVEDRQVEEFKAVVDSPYVDIAAVHLVELIYPSYRARVEEMARYARAKGKPLWSTDTWLSDGGWAYHGPALTPEGYEPFTFETMIEWLHQGEYSNVLEKLDLPWREPLDARWQRAVVYYAQRLGFESVSPFHVQYLVDYNVGFSTPLGAEITSWRESLEERRRTQVFHAYREIIQEVRQRSQEVPPEARAWYERVDAWLDEKLVEWTPEEYGPMNFCAHHIVASEQAITRTDETMDRLFLEMLKETGIDCVRLSIYPYHYERYQERYDRLIERIQASGLKLMVAYMVGVVPIPSFEEYKRLELEFTETFLRRHRPEYYAVVTEPITMEKRVVAAGNESFRISDEQWLQLVREVTALAKSINPDTQVIAAVNNEELSLARRLALLEEVDIVAFQLYGPAGLYEEYRGWLGEGDVVGETIAFAEEQGKRTWITETWLSQPQVFTWEGAREANPYFHQPFMAPLDAKWMRVIVYYAQRHGVEGISPFFTGKFVCYPATDDPQEGLRRCRQALEQGARTAVFYAYHEAITAVRSGAQQNDLSQVRVATLYETVIDQMRDADEVAHLLVELHTGYLHRGFFRWRGMAPIERQYDVYSILAEAIAHIKARNPHLLLGGAIAAQEINAVEYNPLTSQVIPQEATWEMALDPQEYGFDLSREELHERYWEITGSEDYIFPDILDPDFQQLFLDHVKLQIDAGVDAVWIDGLFSQAGIFARLTGSTSHPAIEQTFEGIRHLVDEIHGYAASQGKQVYVGSWAQTAYPYSPPRLDFVTISPTADEVRALRLDEDRWREKLAQVEATYGPVPVIAFIDWAFTVDTPLGVFSQELTKEQAREALRNFDDFFQEHGVLFAYPVHGGYMGRDATRLVFGQYYKYDSLAPEFESYETIRELARERYDIIPRLYLPLVSARTKLSEK